MSLVKLFFSFAVLFLVSQPTESHVKFSHANIRSVNSPDPNLFLDDLFQRYGSNGSMDVGKFKDLLEELDLGRKEVTGKTPECYPPKMLLDSFSVNASGLNRKGFEKICPALVQQIESKACSDQRSDTKEEVQQGNDKTKAWGFGFLSVTIISICSLFGAFVVPFMNKAFYKTLLLLMVSLAVGVLCGSGVFHLIPHAFGFGLDGDFRYLWKCLTIVGGVYLFFFLEYVMKMIVMHKEAQHKKSGKVFEVNGHSIIPGSDIAEVQLEVYNTDPGKHGHSHLPVFAPSQNHVNKKDPENGKLDCNGIAVPPTNSEVSPEKKTIKPVAWMIIIGDGLHNFIDGLAIGASFSTSSYVGLSTSLAIFCEELPHELGDFAVLLNAGMSYRAAMFFNFLSACSCYLGLIIGLLLGYTTSAVKWIYALAGGMFIYISLVDMLAEATEMTFREGAASLKKHLKTFALQNLGMLFGLMLMFILALYTSKITV